MTLALGIAVLSVVNSIGFNSFEEIYSTLRGSYNSTHIAQSPGNRTEIPPRTPLLSTNCVSISLQQNAVRFLRGSRATLDDMPVLFAMYPYGNSAIMRCDLSEGSTVSSFNNLFLTFGIPENSNFPNAVTQVRVYTNDRLAASNLVSPDITRSLLVQIEEASRLTIEVSCPETLQCGEVYFIQAELIE